MKALLAIAIFLCLCSVADAQMACVPIAPTAQHCTVTISWLPPALSSHGNPLGYFVQRSTSPEVKIVTGLTTVDIFSDPGNVKHCWDVEVLYVDARSEPSNVECWTTPPMPARFIDIVTDQSISVTRCKTDTCKETLQVRKNTKLKINGAAK